MTVDEMINALRAAERGEKMEQKWIAGGCHISQTAWHDSPPTDRLDFSRYDYRIKPREPREFWIMPSGRCGDGKVQMVSPTQFKSEHGEVIHVREVL